jgi:hypothetical protein
MDAAARTEVPPIGSARRRFLTDLAEGTADDYCAEHSRIEPELILDENDVTISYGDYGPHFDGMLHHEDGAFHVYCNLTRCGSPEEGRARFTLAHELGHFLIPEHHAALRRGLAPSHPSFCNRPDAKFYVEKEADFFASRLLMPEARFAETARRAGHGLAAMRQVAQELGTSLQSTARRFEDSLTHPCVFVMWREAKEPWFVVSAALRRHGYVFVKTRTERVKGSATQRALCSPLSSSGEIHESATIMSHWFSGTFEGSAKDIPLREEAMRTTYGTFTWLSVEPNALTHLPTCDGV